MSIINPPAWLQAGSYDARTDRTMVGNMIKSPGVVSPTDIAITQSVTPGMSVVASSGGGYVTRPGNDLLFGVYAVRNDGNYTKTITASHATLTRIDLIVLRVYDAQYAGASNLADIEVIPGTPAGSPVAPTMPDAAIELARVTVAGGATSIVNANISTANRQYARLQNKLTSGLEVASAPQSTLTAYQGQQVFVPGSGMQLFDGTNWVETWSVNRMSDTQVFLASGTWTKPAHLLGIRVRVLGAGGAGGGSAATGAGQMSCGAGGGAGAYSEAYFDASALGSTVTVTVGTGGVAVTGADGGAGGASSFGAFLTAGGGGGGTTAAATTSNAGITPGAAGAQGTVSGSSGSAFRASGVVGNRSFMFPSAPQSGMAGNGASNVFGGGGASSGFNNVGAGGGVGGGGGGGTVNFASQATARAGGAGGNGLVLVENFYA